MTEPELSEQDDFGIRRDRVMERLARLLAEATNPPDARSRLRDALKRGDFSSFTEDASPAENED